MEGRAVPKILEAGAGLAGLLVVDRGRLGRVGRDKSSQGPDHARPTGHGKDLWILVLMMESTRRLFLRGVGIIEHSGRGSWGEEGCF